MQKRGFTLIEILIVLTLISLLLTLALPRYFGAVDKAKDTVLEHNLKEVRRAIDQYFADNGKLPAALDTLVDSHYLRSIPVDPVTGSSRTWITQPSTNADLPGITDIKSGASGTTHDGRSYDAL